MSEPSYVYVTDIDADGDIDMFIGETQGNIHFYRNVGTAQQAEWQLVTEEYNGINVGSNSVPTFVDIDTPGAI